MTTLSSSGGSLVFSTYLGGNAGEDGYGIATDSAGGVYVTGRTWSTDFPTQDPVQPSYQGGDSDAFVVVYAPSGARGFGTYFGGSARDDGWDIEVDGQGSIYVAGLTGSTNFPLVNPIQATYGGAGDDGFVARFFPNGSSVAYSTYLGGNLSDQARALDVRGNTDVYVTGSTGSTNFPLVSPYQGVLAGYNDIFISRITDSTPPHEESRSITYAYDPLYRLTAGDYDDGTYFHYTYDPVGNRLTETTVAGTTTYVYDNANRLTSVGGVLYAWSDNGNLLSDGTYTYVYDHANRLTSATWRTLIYGFAYDGLGDRLRQTVAGTPTQYTLDLAGGLTQVLSDGTNAYLYGNARIGEEQPGGRQYYLGDALGSVRQLADASVSVTLSRAYEPFGDPLLTTGTGSSIYGFTGEQRDATGLVYLRARYYAPSQGRFLTRDIWEGDPNQPMSYHAWAYAAADPVNFVDPTGEWVVTKCEAMSNRLMRDACRYSTVDSWTSRFREPPYVTWLPRTTLSYVGDIPVKFSGAQFYVPDYLQYPGQVWDVDEQRWVDVSHNGQYCGQIGIAAIAGLDARTVVERWHAYAATYVPGWEDYEGTYDYQLAGFINTEYGDSLSATTFDEQVSSTFAWDWLRLRLFRGEYVIPLVWIMSGHADDPHGGQVGAGGSDVQHWVVITGMSLQWRAENESSPWNWLRIYNPFMNMTEYYGWLTPSGNGFKRAWLRDTATDSSPARFTGLTVSRTP